jgi:metal-responsive CopG/Arc/MetJ family transcriptional regulator
MIKEHEEVMCDISRLLTDILKPYTRDVKFTVKYLSHEVDYNVLEVFILSGKLQDIDHRRLVKEIKKTDIVAHIYTLEKGSLYTILLKPLEEIRCFKINKLQKKITK